MYSGPVMVSITITAKGRPDRRELLDKVEIVVGRGEDSDLVLTGGSVSKRHARVLVRSRQVLITDLESSNGTHVNGRKIKAATIVRPDDVVYLGEYVLRIELADE